MRIIILFAVFSSIIVSHAQDFSTNRIIPMLEQHEQYRSIFGEASDLSNLQCPPKLEHNHQETFTFLDSLPLNGQLEEAFLNTFMSQGCLPFYSILSAHQNALPTYLTALNKHELDERYSILPLTISANNPHLKYIGDKSGAWQLSFVTASKYGLEINQWYDERNDIPRSSEAAASYLKFLSDYYLNNEMLVITAYYTSVPFVNKQISKLDTVNSVSFYNALNPEIQGFFSYLKAWSNWLEQFQYPRDTEYFSRDRIGQIADVKDTLSFDLISEFMGISIDQIELMNPLYVGGKVIPGSTHPFYLPKEKADIFDQTYADFVVFQKEEELMKKQALAALKKQLEQGIPDLTKNKAVTYTVRSGDVLGLIASRNQVKVSHIKQWNNLRSDNIRAGQKLVLYVPKNKETDLPKESADNQIKIKPSVAVAGNGTARLYTVKDGESLWLISKKFPGVSAENIMLWNGCTDKISPGMQLKIYDAQP